VTPERFWQQLQQALVEATGGFKGPSVLLIPSDYFNAMVPPCPEDMRIAAIAACDNSRQKQGFQPDVLAQVLRQPLGQALRQALQGSRQPLIIAGPALSDSADLQQFSLATGIPVATTMECTSAFPHQHD